MTKIPKHDVLFNVQMKAKHDILSDIFNFIKNELIIIEEKMNLDDIFICGVSNLELSVRSMNCLKNDNIIYIGDLVTKTESEMLEKPNFGKKSLNEIILSLNPLGLSLGMKYIMWPRYSVPVIPREYHNFYEKFKYERNR